MVWSGDVFGVQKLYQHLPDFWLEDQESFSDQFAENKARSYSLRFIQGKTINIGFSWFLGYCRYRC